MRIQLMAAGMLAMFAIPVVAQDYGPQVSEIVTAITKSMAAGGKKSVAVLDLTDLNGRANCFGQLLAEEISVGLVSAGQGFEIVSRNDAKLRAVIKEQKLGASGIIEPQSAVKVGQVVGVQALVTGTVTAIGDRVRVTVTLIDSATARIVGGAATQIPRTKAIDEYLTSCDSGSPTGVRADGASADQSSRAPANVNTVVRTVSGGVEIALVSCQQTSTLRCDFRLTAIDKDVSVVFWGNASVVIDDNGREFKSERAELAGQVFQNMQDFKLLVKGVPTSLRFSFGVGAERVERIALVRLRDVYGGITPEFRNVAVSR